MITTQLPVDCYQILIDYNEDDDKEEEHDVNITLLLPLHHSSNYTH